MHLCDLFDEFELYCRTANRSPRTIAWYREYVTAFERFLSEHGYSDRCADIRTRTIREYVASLQERYAPPTVAGKVRALKGLFAFGLREGLIDTDPTRLVPVPKIPQTDYDVFDPEDIDTLLKACDTKRLTGIRDAAIVWLLFDSGVRAAELCGIGDEDIDWQRGFVRVLGKGAKERLVPVSARTLRAVRRYVNKRNQSGYEFAQALFINDVGEPLSYSALAQLLRRLGNRTGLAVKAHKFRHSFAVNALRNDAREFDIQDCLGHTTLYMTKHYARQTKEDLARRHKRFSPADRLKTRV